MKIVSIIGLVKGIISVTKLNEEFSECIFKATKIGFKVSKSTYLIIPEKKSRKFLMLSAFLLIFFA